MNEPVKSLSIPELEAAIRRHRDYRGDDRCFQDDAELYAVLPEGDTRPARETAVTIENCARYIECRQSGREYISPQRRIEELEVENARLRETMAREGDIICQALGQALGYPWYKDDQANFPLATESDGVCVGDHVAASIAAEAAQEIVAMKRENIKFRSDIC